MNHWFSTFSCSWDAGSSACAELVQASPANSRAVPPGVSVCPLRSLQVGRARRRLDQKRFSGCEPPEDGPGGEAVASHNARDLTGCQAPLLAEKEDHVSQNMRSTPLLSASASPTVRDAPVSRGNRARPGRQTFSGLIPAASGPGERNV